MSQLDEIENNPFFANPTANTFYGDTLPYNRKLCRRCGIAPVIGQGKASRHSLYCSECKPLAEKERWARAHLKEKAKKVKE